MINRPIYRYGELSGSITQSKEIGIQVSFQDKGVFKSTYTTLQQTKNQLINYILTNPGERLFDPYFGSGVRALLFEPNTELEVVEDKLKEGIQNYVQNITVNSVNATSKNNEVYINVNYTILNQTDDLTIAIETPNE